MMHGPRTAAADIKTLLVRSMSVAALAGTVLSFAFPAHARASCEPIRFEAGASSAVISGTVPGHPRDDPDPTQLCYTLAVSGGQHAEVALISGRNVAITIPGVGDANDRFAFTTRRGTYELHVFQLFPGGGEEPFRMRVEVSPLAPESR